MVRLGPTDLDPSSSRLTPCGSLLFFALSTCPMAHLGLGYLVCVCVGVWLYVYVLNTKSCAVSARLSRDFLFSCCCCCFCGSCLTGVRLNLLLTSWPMLGAAKKGEKFTSTMRDNAMGRPLYSFSFCRNQASSSSLSSSWSSPSLLNGQEEADKS